MHFCRICQALVLGAFLMATPSFAVRTHRAATSGHHRTHKHAHVVKGQRGIEPERALQIQNALIREHYLSAPASGQWDAETETAMQKYQSDHGWQTKLTPDSRALIKLGLGPHDDAPATGGLAAPATATAATSASDAGSAPATAAVAGTLADAHTIQN